MAASGLKAHVAGIVSPEEMEALTVSVAAQLRDHQGHACIFLDSRRQIVFELKELEGGGCTLSTGQREVDIERLFKSLGFSPRSVPETLGRLNLGQSIQFRDRTGAAAVLRYDPKTRSITATRLGGGPS